MRRATNFTLSPICESYKSAIRETARTCACFHVFRRCDRKSHYELIAAARQAYKVNRENSAISLSDYMSLVLDRADQSAFGLPHFVTVTKETKVHTLKVKLIGIMEHSVDKK